jgi:hypothetical protein
LNSCFEAEEEAGVVARFAVASISVARDKENRIEVLDRIVSGVTMKNGRGATMKYDYGRNGVAR